MALTRSPQPFRTLSSVGAHLGRGIIAGIAATALMSVSTAVEMRVRGRQPSDAPSKAAGKVLGVQPRGPEGTKRFGRFVHWSYGAWWGAVGGVLRLILPEPWSSSAHFAVVWGTGATLLPAIEVVPPIGDWGAQEIAVDVWHHLVYVASFATAWSLLGRGAPPTTFGERLLERVGDAGDWVKARVAG